MHLTGGSVAYGYLRLMKQAAAKMVAKATAHRVMGEQPSTLQAMVAAAVTGTIAAGLTYRVLRHGSVSDAD